MSFVVGLKGHQPEPLVLYRSSKFLFVAEMATKTNVWCGFRHLHSTCVAPRDRDYYCRQHRHDSIHRATVAFVG
jgi:hypothetical protein